MPSKKGAATGGASRKGGSTKGGAKKGSTKKGSAKKGAAKKSTKSASKRELIDTGSDKRYMRRDPEGRFDESDDMGRSLAADRRTPAKKKVPKGQGDRGDQKR